jgi:hypothetical protein
MHIVDAQQHAIGTALAQTPQQYRGYINASQLGQPLTLVSAQDACLLPQGITYLPYTVEPNLLKPQHSMVAMSAIQTNQHWEQIAGSTWNPQGYQTLRSQALTNQPSRLSLELHRGDSLLLQSATTANNTTVLSINAAQNAQYPLPKSTGWVILQFDFPGLPERFSVTLENTDPAPDAWLAVRLRNQAQQHSQIP